MTELVDLTWPLVDGLTTYPGGGRVALLPKWDHGWSGPRYEPPSTGTAERIIVIDEHVGTHMDAPFHFIASGRTIDEIRVEEAVGSAIVFKFADKDPNSRVTTSMVQSYLEQRGLTIEPGDFALFNLWSGPKEDPGRHTVGAIDVDLAQWLVEQGVRLVGLDLASVDQGTGRSFPAHVALLGADVLIVENLVNMASLPESRVEFFAPPLPLVGGTGSPVRALARF